MAIKITLVRPEGCAHCSQVKETLDKLKNEYNLKVEELDVASSKGLKLVQKYNIMASPGILINNKFFAMGGATESQLKKEFEKLNKK